MCTDTAPPNFFLHVSLGFPQNHLYILFKFYSNFVQILFRFCSNFVQKFYSNFVSKILFKFCFKILFKFYSNFVQILFKVVINFFNLFLCKVFTSFFNILCRSEFEPFQPSFLFSPTLAETRPPRFQFPQIRRSDFSNRIRIFIFSSAQNHADTAAHKFTSRRKSGRNNVSGRGGRFAHQFSLGKINT